MDALAFINADLISSKREPLTTEECARLAELDRTYPVLPDDKHPSFRFNRMVTAILDARKAALPPSVQAQRAPRERRIRQVGLEAWERDILCQAIGYMLMFKQVPPTHANRLLTKIAGTGKNTTDTGVFTKT